MNSPAELRCGSLLFQYVASFEDGKRDGKSRSKAAAVLRSLATVDGRLSRVQLFGGPTDSAL